ncbi:MAG: class I SAM-dependent methyltransferase, partial [Planctomycetota bacterium]
MSHDGDRPAPDFAGRAWPEFEYFDEAWRDRIRLMASFLASGASVGDLGCGPQWLREERPDLADTGVDYTARTADTAVADFNRGEFPSLDVDWTFASGVLEYVQDPEWFIAQCCAAAPRCVLSYCLTETHPDRAERRRWGWVNDLDLPALRDCFARRGFTLVGEHLTASRNTVLVWARAPESPPVVPPAEDTFPVSELDRLERRTWILQHARRRGVGAEFGVFRGHFAEVLVRRLVPTRLYLVDAWTLLGERFGWGDLPYTNYDRLTTAQARADAERRLAASAAVYDVRLVEAAVTEFCDTLAREATRLDWAYLDTCHGFEETVQQLQAIARIVRRDGVILGDDWS